MEDFKEDLTAALETLRNGGLILYPTDTVWGIGCDATDEEAVARVYAVKKREDHKSLIVLVAEERDILQYTAAADPGVFTYLEKAQKPTTVIYSGALGLASNLISKDGSVGIRICKEPFCRALIKRLRKPLVSTSANISGEPTATFFDEISDAVKQKMDYIVTYRQQDKTPAQPSSVIRWEDGKISVIRP